jgi:hypothetical protein
LLSKFVLHDQQEEPQSGREIDVAAALNAMLLQMAKVHLIAAVSDLAAAAAAVQQRAAAASAITSDGAHGLHVNEG